MLIIGHRGAAGLSKENTVSSLKKAEELGVDMVEIDLRLVGTEIVAAHSRLSKKKKPTTLTEILESSKIPINFEIKETGFEKEFLNQIKNFTSEVLVSSKHIGVLKKIRALDEKVKLALVIGKANFFLLAAIRRLDKTLQFYSIHPSTILVTQRVLRHLKQLNKKIYVWTINDPDKFKKLKDSGIDGVFTDRPDLIKN